MLFETSRLIIVKFVDIYFVVESLNREVDL